MSVKFKCNQSGNIFEFFTDHDIKTMRAHSEYTEITEVEVIKKEEPSKIGRPKKIKEEE